ncbi:hypothetical protein [Phenylobacterium sp.]|uniref:hypothetical protein n=1 Tax=Phenylobacterium sp. TaxID=1871053 RepID=UPI002603BB8C|nr:hypothetical protein [Phenylobacterium sp.]
MTERVKLTEAQWGRLRQLQRPGYFAVASGNPDATDRKLAQCGLIILGEVYGRPGYYRARITDEGCARVSADDYEHCATCSSLIHKDEAACVYCGATKQRENDAGRQALKDQEPHHD